MTLDPPAVALAVALLALGPTACRRNSDERPQTPETTLSRDAQTGGPEVVAELDGVSITTQDLEDRVRARLARVRQEEYDTRKQGLDALIGERLLDAEARRRGLTREALLEAEVGAKVERPSAAEVDRVYEQVRARLGGRTRQEAGPDIERSLLAQASSNRREELVSSLRSKARLFVRLDPPRTEVVIPASAPVYGPANAAVTIVGFSDFQCPFCHRAQGTMDKILETYGRRVRLVHRDFPLEGHAEATPAARAARCAGEQKRYWEYHRGLMTEPGDLGPGDLAARATRVGLDAASFAACLASTRHAEDVKADLDSGMRLGVSGTPTYFVNGRMITGARPFEAFAEVIDAELTRSGS